MNTNNEGYGLTVFPTTFGTKAIDSAKLGVANTISAEFGQLAKVLKSMKPVTGREIEAQNAWSKLSALALEIEGVYCGTPIVGHA